MNSTADAVACESVMLWNPVGFEPRDHLPPELHKYSDHARFLMHRVFYAGVFDRRKRKGFVPLNATATREFFPHPTAFTSVRDALIETEALISNRHYIVGVQPMGYRLGPEYQGKAHVQVPVTDRLLAKKLRNRREEWRDRDGSETGVHRHLYRNLHRLRIDYEAAVQRMGRLRPEKRIYNEATAATIRRGEWRLIVCPYGRVHTNLTNLWERARQNLTVDGERLVNLDIRNSQPLIFNILLQSGQEPAGRDAEGSRMPPGQTLPLCCKSGESADVRHYADLTQSGQFYDYLMGEMGWTRESADRRRRGRFKRRFFGRVFFCRNDPIRPEAELFARLFPNVYEAVRAMKAEDHRLLAHRLQRAESDLMIGKVAGRIMAEMPEAFLATIHDSLLAKPEDAGDMKAILEDEFRKAGLDPTVNVLPYRRPGANR